MHLVLKISQFKNYLCISSKIYAFGLKHTATDQNPLILALP